MPFELSWEPRGVYRRYHGRVMVAERLRSLQMICADPRFDDLRYTITDFTEVSDFEVTERSTEEIAALHVGPLHTNPRIVIAAVAVQPEVLEAIRHFIELGFTDRPYRVFATLAEARNWVAG